MDSRLWWNTFEFEHWNPNFTRPSNEVPIYNAANLERLKTIYENLAGRRRLVVKNPSNLARIPLIQEMFPDAKFVFCVRNPWQTISSISSKVLAGHAGHESFLLRTPSLSFLNDDFLLRATHSWSEAIKMYCRNKDENWSAVRYEDVVLNPQTEIDFLYRTLDIDDDAAKQTATKLPRLSEKSNFAVKKCYDASLHSDQIDDLLTAGCEVLDYEIGFDQLNVSSIRHMREKLTGKALLKKARHLLEKRFSQQKATAGW